MKRDERSIINRGLKLPAVLKRGAPHTGFHRMRHYGLLANPIRQKNIELARTLLSAPPVRADPSAIPASRPTFVCYHCGAPMLIIQILARAQHIRAPPAPST